MGINASGQVSLAGATAGQSIAGELALGATTQISLNDASVRGLAAVASGVITMPTNFYGKSNVAPFNGWDAQTATAIGGNAGTYVGATSSTGITMTLGMVWNQNTIPCWSRYDNDLNVTYSGTFGGTASPYGVAVNSSNVFVGCFKDAGNALIRYTDAGGSSWTTAQSFAGSPVGMVYSSLINKFVCYCASIGVGNSFVVTSTDGITWSAPTYFSASFVARSIAVSGLGRVMLISYNTTDYTNMHSESSDGINWTTITRFNTIPNGTSNALVSATPTGFMAVFGYANYGRTMTSTDGASWSALSQMPYGVGYGGQSAFIATNKAGVSVAIGTKGGNTFVAVQSTDNGATWTNYLERNVGAAGLNQTRCALMVRPNGKFIFQSFNKRHLSN